MKYYSTDLKKFFDDAESCEKAEAEYQKTVAEKEEKEKQLKAERKERAAEVDNAYKACKDAEKHYYELRNQFIQQYGSYHATYTNTDSTPFSSLFDMFFNI